MNYIEIAKELMKSKTIAYFSHYCNGSIYYVFTIESGKYQFPISTIEHIVTENGLVIQLSSDLGITPFNSEMKASELNRWIKKAIEKENLIKIG